MRISLIPTIDTIVGLTIDTIVGLTIDTIVGLTIDTIGTIERKKGKKRKKRKNLAIAILSRYLLKRRKWAF